MRRCQYDQNTLKFDQKHHFYATILARRRQTLKSGEPRSPDPGVYTGMVGPSDRSSNTSQATPFPTPKPPGGGWSPPSCPKVRNLAF